MGLHRNALQERSVIQSYNGGHDRVGRQRGVDGALRVDGLHPIAYLTHAVPRVRKSTDHAHAFSTRPVP
jgi:hypothetical protein